MIRESWRKADWKQRLHYIGFCILCALLGLSLPLAALSIGYRAGMFLQ